MAQQTILEVATRGRAMYEITADVDRFVSGSELRTGIAHIFARHTSCSVIITENADPAVRHDLEMLAKRWAPDGDPAYRHDTEGDDDMPAHGRAILAGAAVSVPFAAGKLLLGTWQGIFVWEHRAQPHTREVCVTLVG